MPVGLKETGRLIDVSEAATWLPPFKTPVSKRDHKRGVPFSLCQNHRPRHLFWSALLRFSWLAIVGVDPDLQIQIADKILEYTTMKDTKRLTLTAVAFAIFASSLPAQTLPPSPPMTNGGDPANNGMKHLNVALSKEGLSIPTDSPPASPLTMTSGHGVDFTANKFDVLEDGYFNGQYGWLPDGLFDAMPADASIWIKRTGATSPSGSTFKVYEGGNMREGMDTWSMNEIHATGGTPWQWDGAMQHDYYVADLPGRYSMTFDVFVGDSNGLPTAQFAPATATVDFQVVPEPATGMLGAIGLLTGVLLIRPSRDSR